MSRTRKVVYQRRVYDIPDIWIAGWCTGARLRGEPSRPIDAIAAWAYQVALSELEQKERS